MRREVILPVGPSAALKARTALNDAIPPPALDGRYDDARLALSEVVTNAVLHADLNRERDVIRLVMETDDSHLRVEVEQQTSAGDAHPATPRTDPADRPGGFGLMLVEALADDWGAEAGPPGYVWFEFRLEEPAAVQA